MKQMMRSTAMLLAAATILSGVQGRSIAASPETLAQVTGTFESYASYDLPTSAVKVVATLEKFIPRLKALTVRTVDQSDDGKSVYLTMEDPKNPESYASLEFDLGTGLLMGYQVPIQEAASGKRETYEFIQQRVDQLVMEIYGSEKRKMIGEPHYYSDEQDEQDDPIDSEFTFHVSTEVFYPYLVNGLDLEGTDYGLLIQTEADGDIISISLNIPNLQGTNVPDPKGVLKQDVIKKQYFTPSSFDLGYFREGYAGTPELLYVLRSLPVFDATTGKAIDSMNGAVIEDNRRNSVNNKKITLTPQARPLIVNNELDASKILFTMFGVDTKEDYARYYKHEYRDELEYHWSNEFPNFGSSGVSVNPTTGQLISAGVVTQSPEIPVNLTRDEALKKAISFLEPYALTTSATMRVEIDERVRPIQLTNWMKEVEKKEKGDDKDLEQIYNFTFYELHNNVPVFNHYYNVNVNGASGKVEHFRTSLPMKEIALPDVKLAATEQQASEFFIKNVPLRLSYRWPTYYGVKGPELKLVYTLDDSKGWPYVDALSGTLKWDE
ncbi:YcdB/YcdC domain-containing protein [Brevibacillus reuszeri]|uniref:YcdB/YcdC domain-containing protein n=1 Tax=Brevibacillus reuszeri TaxID=54915 RepID=UPI003D1EE7A0